MEFFVLISSSSLGNRGSTKFGIVILFFPY